jgi:hypothetical protein
LNSIFTRSYCTLSFEVVIASTRAEGGCDTDGLSAGAGAAAEVPSAAEALGGDPSVCAGGAVEEGAEHARSRQASTG